MLSLSVTQDYNSKCTLDMMVCCLVKFRCNTAIVQWYYILGKGYVIPASTLNDNII